MVVLDGLVICISKLCKLCDEELIDFTYSCFQLLCSFYPSFVLEHLQVGLHFAHPFLKILRLQECAFLNGRVSVATFFLK